MRIYEKRDLLGWFLICQLISLTNVLNSVQCEQWGYALIA
jgi:hypothetical protein